MKRQIIHIDQEKCNGCGACAAACHEGAIAMIGGKATLMRDDTTNHDWKLVGADQPTEAAAEAVLKAILGGAA